MGKDLHSIRSIHFRMDNSHMDARNGVRRRGLGSRRGGLGARGCGSVGRTGGRERIFDTSWLLCDLFIEACDGGGVKSWASARNEVK